MVFGAVLGSSSVDFVRDGNPSLSLIRVFTQKGSHHSVGFTCSPCKIMLK